MLRKSKCPLSFFFRFFFFERYFTEAEGCLGVTSGVWAARSTGEGRLGEWQPSLLFNRVVMWLGTLVTQVPPAHSQLGAGCLHACTLCVTVGWSWKSLIGVIQKLDGVGHVQPGLCMEWHRGELGLGSALQPGPKLPSRCESSCEGGKGWGLGEERRRQSSRGRRFGEENPNLILTPISLLF